MLSTPRSLGFVLAAILGAMLVPGCRPEHGPVVASTQMIPDQSSGRPCRGSGAEQAIKRTSAEPYRVAEVADRSETRPAAPCPVESGYRRRP